MQLKCFEAFPSVVKPDSLLHEYSVTKLGNFLKLIDIKFSYKSSPNNW